MNKSQMNIGLFLLFFLIFISCSKKLTTVEGDKVSLKTFETLYSEVGYPDTSFFGTGRVKLNTNDFKVAGQFKMYMDKEHIWMQVSKFGFEGGRLLIQRDSVKMINRLQKTYFHADATEASNKLGLSLSFEDLKAVIWGVPPRRSASDKLTIQSQAMNIKGKDAQDQLTYSYVAAYPWQLQEGQFIDRTGMRKFEFDNDAFQYVTNKYLFSYIRSYDLIDFEDRNQVELEFDDIQLGKKMDVDFNIPSTYTRM